MGPESMNTAVPRPVSCRAYHVPTPAVRFTAVSKSYRLYDRPHERLIDQMGLNRLLFWRRDNAASYHLFHALNGITLTINTGERVGIIGRNGAGKTTLLKLVTENFSPSEGTVEVNGTVQALMQLGIGFHQEFSGYENIKAALHYNGLVGADFKEALEDVIDFVELGDFLHQPMKTYSLGMAARLQFAAATAIKPDILIVDEVLGAGDAYFSAKSALRMQKLTRSGCTLLLVSHSWQLVQQFCERAIWLMNGSVHLDGVAHEVLAAYEAYVASETTRLASASHQSPVQVSIDMAAIESSHKLIAAESACSNALEFADTSAGFAIADNATVRQSEGAWPGSTESCPGEPVDIELPKASGIEWIAENLRQKESYTKSDEDVAVLRDGKKIYRVLGKKGLRFQNVIIRSGGKRVASISTGDPLSFEMWIASERGGRYDVSYWIHFFTIGGSRVARIRSAIDHFSLKEGEVRNIVAKLDKTLLGSGEYLISFSMFDQSTTSSTVDIALRYEMLARSFQLTITGTNDSDPPVIHHPSVWIFNSSTETQEGDLSSMI